MIVLVPVDCLLLCFQKDPESSTKSTKSLFGIKHNTMFITIIQISI